MNWTDLLLVAVDSAPPRAGWVGIVLTILLVAGVVTISIKNAKRTHQD